MPDSNFSVSVTYDGVTNTVTDNTNIVLNTNRKIPSSNLEIVGNNVESLMFTYNGSSRIITNSFNTKTLNIKNKILKDDIRIKIGPLEVNYIELYSDASFTIRSQTSRTSTTRRKNWDGTMYYSYNTLQWDIWDGANVDLSAGLNTSDNKYYLYLRGEGNTVATGGNSSNIRCWTLQAGSAPIYCNGDIKYLLDYSGETTTLATCSFQNLFYNWTWLKTAPTLSSFSTLTNRCYRGMFYGCTNLETAPALPSMTLAQYCYQEMFYGCVNLNTIPALPAKNTKDHCYYYMFQNCSKIAMYTSTGTGRQKYTIPETGSLTAEGTDWKLHMFAGTSNNYWDNNDPTVSQGVCNLYTTNTIIPSS